MLLCQPYRIFTLIFNISLSLISEFWDFIPPEYSTVLDGGGGGYKIILEKPFNASAISFPFSLMLKTEFKLFRFRDFFRGRFRQNQNQNRNDVVPFDFKRAFSYFL